MTLSEMTTLLKAEVRHGQVPEDRELLTAFSGDMLSDVLALGQQPDILLTGLVNPQVIRTAEMLDTACVVFVRGKAPTESIIGLADSCGVTVLSSEMDLFEASGVLFAAGILPA